MDSFVLIMEILHSENWQWLLFIIHFLNNDRRINDWRVKKDAFPAPTDFNFDESFKKTIKKDLMVKLGKAKREVDFTKCKDIFLITLDSAHHSTLVEKGIF